MQIEHAEHRGKSACKPLLFPLRQRPLRVARKVQRTWEARVRIFGNAHKERGDLQ